MSGQASEPKLFLPVLQPFYDAVVPLAWPLVRCAAGLILAYHGWGKIAHGPFVVAPQFAAMGFEPAVPIVFVLILIEFVGGLGIAIGLFTRFFAAAAAIEMGILTFHVYWGAGFPWLKGGFEYVLLWGLILLAVALRGGGPYSLDRRLGREL
jgi:putative oxidoreductase